MIPGESEVGNPKVSNKQDLLQGRMPELTVFSGFSGETEIPKSPRVS